MCEAASHWGGVTENSVANRHKQSLLWKISEFFVPGEVKGKGGFWEDQAVCVCVFSHLVPPTITLGISDNHAKVLRTHTHSELNLCVT